MNRSRSRTVRHSLRLSERWSLWSPIIFLALAFLMGGASRSDVESLPLLRFLCVLFATGYAFSLTRDDWRRIRVPLVLLTLVTLWLVVQLIPLPPEIWHTLPGREPIVAIDRQLGLENLWRPISLTPSLTWNSLFGMTVPFAALLMAARLPVEVYPRVLLALIAIAGIAVLIGFFQIAGGMDSPAYLYRITNRASMTGLFANRNHYAVFLACMVLVSATLLRDELSRRRRNSRMIVLLAVAAPLFGVTSLLTGSRAGLAMSIAALLLGGVIAVRAWRKPTSSGPAVGATGGWNKLAYLVPVLLIGAVFAIDMFSGRVTALDRLADKSVGDDMRVVAWPIISTMIAHYWLVGSGMGSFAPVYKIYEPDRLLTPSYFNHAHNDWAEIVMTGGVPFLLITIAAIAWIVYRTRSRGLDRLWGGARGDLRLLGIAVLGMLAVASLVDYPLRVPSLQVFAILFVVMLACPKPTGGARD